MRLLNSRGPRSQSKYKCCLLLYLARLVSEYMFICYCFHWLIKNTRLLAETSSTASNLPQLSVD